MAPRPQNSSKGLFAKNGFYAGSQAITTSSTGVTFAGAVFLSGSAAVGKLSANSTAILIPATGFQFAALTARKITSNSTGIRIGTKYISCNSTGNDAT